MTSSPPPPTPEPEPRRESGRLARPVSQRRAHFRTDDDQPVLVQVAPEVSFVARLSDLSESGARLGLGPDTALLLPLGAVADLVVSLPDSNEELRGRVVHRDPESADGGVVVGVAFVEQDRASADRLRRHVYAVQREALARRRIRD